MTVSDEAGTAFEAALASDAGVTMPEATPPPRRDPEAPHGRAADGSAIAPYGLKTDGTPRMKPAGPGRPKPEDRPRVVDSAPTAAGDAEGARRYSETLSDLSDAIWISASSLKGGRLLGVQLPDTRPHAAVWHASSPQLVAAWTAAAVQNPTVRGYVQRLDAQGKWSWVIGVTVATAGIIAALSEVSDAPEEKRAALAVKNDADVKAYISGQLEAMGLQAAGELPEGNPE